ncbi:Maf family protein [Thermodesulfobacteriota bacterium]
MNNKTNIEFPPVSREYPLILASASPRRKRLLQQIGLPFNSMASNIHEEKTEGEPANVAQVLAEKKAMAVHSMYDNAWVLGADTIVVLGEMILGKPKDPGEARSMLNLLSDREHKVITAFSLIYPTGEVAHSEYAGTLVNIKTLSDSEIAAYIATGEPFGKAGAYAIQGIGSFMVKGITGSYSNVVGLPLCALIESLLAVGALNRFPHV